MTTEDTAQRINKLIEAGAHYGYSRSRRHPSIKPFVKETKSRSDFFDPAEIVLELDKAKEFLAGLSKEGKYILFVGSKPEARVLVKEAALSLRQPYVSDRFIGGALTNFPEIKKRIERLHDLLKKKESGDFASHTKKERLLIDREIARMDKNFGGLSDLTNLPAALVIVDPRYENIARTEASACHIPVVALSNSDGDIKGIDYPVVANDSSVATIKVFLEEIGRAISDAKKTDQE